jgi:hypothetical protein
MAKLGEWIQVEEAKIKVLEDIRQQRGRSGLRDYFDPDMLAAFKQRVHGAGEGQLAAIRFNDHDDGDEKDVERPSGMFQLRSKRLGPHTYDMREEWLALGHRFILKHMLDTAVPPRP